MKTKIKSVLLLIIMIIIAGCGNVLGQIHNYGEVFTDDSINGEWILMGMIKEGTDAKQKEEARYTIKSIDGGYLATVQKTAESKERTLFFQLLNINNKNYIQIPWDHGLNIIMKADKTGKNEFHLTFINTDKLKSHKIDNVDKVQSKVIRDLVVEGKDIFDDAKLRFVRVK